MNKLYLLIPLLFYAFSQLGAQVDAGGIPYSFSPSFAPYTQDRSLAVKAVPSINLARLKAEDIANPGYVRFAAPAKMNANLSDGQWIDLPNGGRLWRLQLEAKEALGLFVVYRDFHLPFGAHFYMYSPDQSQVKGAYTYKNNRDGQFMTGMIKGNTAILELFEPKEAKGQSRIQIESIYQAYSDDHIQPSDYPFQVDAAGFGDALSCHININCPEGANWQDHKRAVVRMLRVFEEGIGWCTSTLINNGRQDGYPYVLSAYHCIAGFTPKLDLWRFDFQLESDNCDDPDLIPDFESIMGCQQIAGREESDFLLLELSRSVPSSYDPYFVGWNRDSINAPQVSTGIHHPQGDIKKISVDNDPSFIFQQSITWNNSVTTPANHHFRITFDQGTFENGSSGSALFDQNGLIVGQLHGGMSNCAQFRAFYGRFSLSWNAGPTADTRLREWLDPDNQGMMTLGHYEPPPTALVSGHVRDALGQPVAGVQLLLEGDMLDSMVTDASGYYQFEVTRGGQYTIRPSKSSNPTNGISLLDVVMMQKHILGIELLEEPTQLVAGDINASSDLSVFDVILLRKIILLIDDNFPDDESWRFMEGALQLNNVADDLVNQDFTGVKMGDVSGNANPSD
ncbi:MAG: carboxypeptidase regulatory-like domain-containing protein [Bacteroidota bacterium]